MMNGSFGAKRTNSLLNEYASLVGEAILRKRVHTAEQTAKIESELASRLKSEFIANMSHELRTPLNAALGFSKLLVEHKENPVNDEDVVQYAQFIHSAARQLLTTINNIIDIAKLQSGRYPIDVDEVSVNEIARACVAEAEAASKEADVALHLEIDDSIAIIRGDTAKLKQAISNIVTNAIRFTSPGGEVHVSTTTTPMNETSICITDTGIGMTPEEIEIALTSFGQVDGDHKRWREGTGLGLPISQALIELHGGQITIQSKKDIGSNVTITLPSHDEVASFIRLLTGQLVTRAAAGRGINVAGV